jgi:hypothetical protein
MKPSDDVKYKYLFRFQARAKQKLNGPTFKEVFSHMLGIGAYSPYETCPCDSKFKNLDN